MIVSYASAFTVPYDYNLCSYDRNLLSQPWLELARIVNYESFIILATVITIVNYDRCVIKIIIYDHKNFTVQAIEAHKTILA